MKVLHVLQSSMFSGAENVVCQIIKMFESDPQYEMVYTSPDGQIREALAERNIKFLPMKTLKKQELRRIIDIYKPNIIHAHDRQASFMAATVARGIPIVVHMHVNNNVGVKIWLKNALWTTISGKFKHIFWVSKSSFDGFQFRAFLRNKSSILYNAIDAQSVVKKAIMDPDTHPYDIVYVGRLSYQKNPERLMSILHKVVKKRPSTRIGIVGSGEFAEYIEDYIDANDLKKNICYLGYCINPLGIIRDSKAMVLSSRFEGTPMVVIEAQILGIPVVSTPVDGVAQVISDGSNGFLSNNDAVLADKLVLLLNNQDIQQMMSTKSVEMSSRYTDIEFYRSKINKIYKGQQKWNVQ